MLRGTPLAARLAGLGQRFAGGVARKVGMVVNAEAVEALIPSNADWKNGYVKSGRDIGDTCSTEL